MIDYSRTVSAFDPVMMNDSRDYDSHKDARAYDQGNVRPSPRLADRCLSLWPALWGIV